MLADRPQGTTQSESRPFGPVDSRHRFSEREFVSEFESVGVVRRWARQVLTDCGWEPDSEAVSDFLVVLAELVTNAVVHAQVPGRSVLVRLRQVGDGCRVEVVDGRPDLMPQTDLLPREESGRGLLLVRDLAAAMGVERSGEDKIVWAKVHHQGQLRTAA
ncbi:ATP-binding protein [Kitasatospora sp. NA04385]|uniref:ATP-binding protein n=1 Tax=Kitasatospora sp. NA04385 TaxID=2742135 RepID=UPI00158FD3CB|nr:ATP-binding protein [Kitasatospora sp. NA04385]QKW22275.1 ATP-binding protein [Kitasatospora sp. NA04385]